jgi:hypothetical protein
MDWFERLTGFAEESYEATRAKLRVSGQQLESLVNRKSFGIGVLELASLAELRRRVAVAKPPSGRLRVSIVTGDVRQMHKESGCRGALFQAASQFNLLEMVGPEVRPENGVTRYQNDHTQGPACAIAAGAATIYRNYFAPVGVGFGQNAERQLDGLAETGERLSKLLDKPIHALWTMRNGYALCSRSGLDAISKYITTASGDEIDVLRGSLRIGIQTDVEVTDVPQGVGQLVSQAFCSALPVAYSDIPARCWRSFALLVLEAAYEATMCAAAINASRGASNTVLLTSLGGGAFGNEDEWILSAMRRALSVFVGYNLDVNIVSYRKPSNALLGLARDFG